MVKKHIAKHSQNKWAVLALLAASFFMVVLDVSIVNVALPSLARDLHFSQNNLQWVITAYSIAFGGFLLLGGRIADVFGRKRIFMTAVACFAIASLICGFAQNEIWLIVSRFIQGLAAAFMTPTALSIVLTEFEEGPERNKALGVWSAVAASGAAVGVLLGGVLTEYLGWRWNFFVNVPVAAIILLIASQLLPKFERERVKEVDYLGALTATAGLMSLVYALSRVPIHGWSSKSFIGFLLLSVVLLGTFIRDEWRAHEPMLPIKLFKNRNIAGGNLIGMIIAASMFANFFFMTLYVQTILGYSPIKSGVSFLMIPFVIAICAGIASKLVGKIGYKPLLIFGPTMLAIGLFISAHILKYGGDYWHNVIPGLVVAAIGMGTSFVPLTLAATTGAPKQFAGVVSGVLNTGQQIGGAVGLAILSTVAASTTKMELTKGFDVPHARVEGFHTGFYYGAGFAILALVVAIFFLKNKKLDAKEAMSAGA